MFKKRIKYTDFDNNIREEDFYFNLTEAELGEMNFSKRGGYSNFIRKIATLEDTVELHKMFKSLILDSYGEKSPDGRRFIKSPELSKAFSETNAYSVMYMEFFEDPNAISDFIKGILPASIRNNADLNLTVGDVSDKTFLEIIDNK